MTAPAAARTADPWCLPRPIPLILASAVAVATLAQPALAQPALAQPTLAQSTMPPPDAEPVATSIWQYAFYKTLTYETLANTADLLILSTLTAGATALGATFLAVDMASAAATYYTHEIAWSFMGPATEDRTAFTTGAKAAGYRVVSLARGYGLAYAYVGNASIATTYTLLAGITHTALYLGNDWAWDRYAPPPRP